MNYETMELDELKEYAKSLGISFGKIGKEKLIEKIKDVEMKNEALSSVLSDDDLEEPEKKDVVVEPENNNENKSLVESISEAIDDLEDSSGGDVTPVVELPLDTVIGVKSITFGGLTYKSRATNAIFRWNQIGAVEYMTVSDLIDMNNYKSDFLRKPLVILMDERAIKRFRLTPVYENVAKINNLTAVFNSDLQTIERVIDDALRVNMRDVLISKVRQMYKNKKLVDINIIDLLEKKLHFDLKEQQ